MVRGAAVVLALMSLVGAEGTVAVEDGDRRRLRAQLGRDLCDALDWCVDVGLDPPVVPLRGKRACSGCNVALPTSQLLNVLHRRGAMQCPRCRRIVYDPARVQAEEATVPVRAKRRRA